MYNLIHAITFIAALTWFVLLFVGSGEFILLCTVVMVVGAVINEFYYKDHDPVRWRRKNCRFTDQRGT